MSTQDKNKKSEENNTQSNTDRKPLPSGTVTVKRPSIFELGSTDKTKNN